MKLRVFLSLGIVLTGLMGMAALAQARVPAATVEQKTDQADAHGLGGGGVLHVAGASFVPETDTTVYSTSDEGDVSVTGTSTPYMHAPVLLPDGAEVSGLTLYFYDDDPGYMRAYLIRNNDATIGSRTVLAQVFSPNGAVGYGSAYSSTDPSPVEIDNARYNYEVEVFWSAGSSDLKLMSVKLFYTNP